MTRKAELGERLTLAAQRNATDAVMLHQAIADRVGLHVTDLRCLNLLRLSGPATAGELAARTGLTTGAVTRMIDRLLAAKFVRREHDSLDRRRVIITAAEDRLPEIARHYEPLAREFGKLMTGYTTEQLELLLDVFDRLHETSQRVAAAIRAAD
ncbi:MarR family winged helix-turn-helix transcriptional regulator [Nocardia pseudobrasiliensis]|uniref:DNA-binding MarR family transcriptional regulator n=1 Tax=Nocardia pseudobrasiliensis TaxID=45979 RepID=A0A370I5D0_9NOCA|nr:MarR family transcriptional regulator [Nocardia pseudobrasiliensis]RDI65946.1 DNA-binding MarR family transcriptional regulator [Nocardia pseudobrasiliensis]